MQTLTLIEGIQLASSLGILSGGVGVLKWAFQVERRIQRLEIQGEINYGKSKKAY